MFLIPIQFDERVDLFQRLLVWSWVYRRDDKWWEKRREEKGRQQRGPTRSKNEKKTTKKTFIVRISS